MRILLVEDNPSDVLLVEEALREHNVSADLEVLADGEVAYSYWDRFSRTGGPPCPDLVLLDINLPKRDGMEILQRIRETPHCAELKVIIVSSSMKTDDLEKARQMGVYEYFRKPSHLDAFMQLGLIIKRLQSNCDAQAMQN